MANADRQMDGRTDAQIPPVFYRTSSPSGPLPKKEEKRSEKGGKKEEKQKRKQRKKKERKRKEERSESGKGKETESKK